MKREYSKIRIRNGIILVTTAFVVVTFVILFILWWNCLLLPREVRYRGSELLEASNGITIVINRSGYKDGEIYRDNNVDHTEDTAATKKLVFLEDALKMVYCLQSASCFDVDHDGDDELVILLWKHGNYGEHMPFFVKFNDAALEQHIFIYDLAERKSENGEDDRCFLKPIWMSSSLGKSISSMEPAENGRVMITSISGRRSLWDWEYFGLKLVKEINE